MTPARLIMDGVALVALVTGLVLLLRRGTTREAARTARRVAGAMLLALGLTLFVFSTTYSAATRP